MESWLNVGSLILGLVAWALPIMAIKKYKYGQQENWFIYLILSISACAISLCFQLIYQEHLVQIEDISAIMDTAGGVAFAAKVLLSITLLLNAVTLYVCRKGRPTSNAF